MVLLTKWSAMVQGRTMKISAGLAAVAVIGLVAMCAEERSTDPVKVSYRLYMGVNASPPKEEAYVLAIDLETHLTVDSLFQPGWTTQLWPIYAAASSVRIVVADNNAHEVLDVPSNTVIARLRHIYNSMVFMPDLGVIVGGKMGGSDVYEDTSFSFRTAIPGLYGCKRLGETSRVIGLRLWNRNGVTFDTVLVYDVAAGQLVDSFVIDPLDDGIGMSFLDFDISTDGARLYGVGGDLSSDWVFGYDIQARQILFKRPPRGAQPGRRVHLTPDGQEIWVTWGSNPFGYPWPQWIDIFDAFSGVALDSIDVRQTTLGWHRAVSPTELCFDPEGQHVFVACGTGYSGTQPLLIIDTQSREISQVMFADASRIPRRLAIGISP